MSRKTPEEIRAEQVEYLRQWWLRPSAIAPGVAVDENQAERLAELTYKYRIYFAARGRGKDVGFAVQLIGSAIRAYLGVMERPYE